MPVNNLELIRPLLNFSDPDKFYYIQLLLRKKDSTEDKPNLINNNSRVIRNYFVSNEEYLDFYFKEMIDLCDVTGARAGIRLNRRSWRRLWWKHERKLMEIGEEERYQATPKAFSAVAGKFSAEGKTKTWIVDVDAEDLEIMSLDEIKDKIESITQPEGQKVIAEIPSKTGWHLITRPFNLQAWRDIKTIPKLAIHKDNPTNLYIP